MQIKVYSTQWCGDCQVTKKYLTQFGIPFEEIDIENDSQAMEYVLEVNGGRRSVPTLEYDGEAISMSRFSRERLADFLERHRLLKKTA